MKRYLLFLGLLLSGGAFTSCESFLDVNDNPNNPSSTTPNFLLPSIISNGIQTQMFTALRTPYITQYIVSRTANSGGNDQYRFTNAQSTNTFNYSYFQSGGNIPPMIAAAQAEGSAYYVGAGKIMQALILAHLTDMMGDVPYSEAYLGSANIKPKYDSQEQLYATVNQLLDEGIMEMSKDASQNSRPFYSTAPSESGDILYKGDVSKWIRLAYSLKARQLNHLTKKSNYDPNAVLALVAQGFRSSADDAQIQFQTAVAPLANTTNIFGTTRANFGTATFSTNIIRYLNGSTFPGVVDPRFGIMTPTTSTGAAPGAGTTGNLTPGSTITDFYASWYARDLGIFEVITYHELKFIEAEAAFRAGNKTRALSAYKAGIQAHMEKIGVGGTFAAPSITFPAITPGQINAYLSSAAVAQTEAQLSAPNDPTVPKAIMEQKYIAMFLNPESWSDMRRYDFRSDVYVNLQYPTGNSVNPVLRDITDPAMRFPRRMLPGATETLYNPDEIARMFAEAGATTNDQYVGKPLWWDRP